MPLTRTTRTDVEAYALSLAGRSRDHLPVPWTNSAVMDDCAAFCSHVLWSGKPGPIIWVDGFKSAGDGTYAAGTSDLAPWDVLLFDWEGNGVGNHVEFMVGDLGNGTVRTYGANGSDSLEARYRTRPTRYIMGRFRPAWGAAAAPLIHLTTPSTTTPIGELMDTVLVRIDTGHKSYNAFLANPETMRCLHLGPGQETFWINRNVPIVEGLQLAQILDGFEQVKGKGAKV